MSTYTIKFPDEEELATPPFKQMQAWRRNVVWVPDERLSDA